MFEDRLNQIKQKGTFRKLPQIEHHGKYIIHEGNKMLNISSNDYLGLAGLNSLKEEFSSLYPPKNNIYSSSSARLLTGNFSIYNDLEMFLAKFYERESALLFNSGYHANIGILPALTSTSSLILADKLIHASIIDGISLSRAKNIRYRHNDYEQLERLIAENESKHDRIFIVTESIFSMDGDICDLHRLVSIKKKYPNILLYVDEAHAVGVRGEQGRGIAEEQDVLQEIDLLIGTFGKALASIGAFAITSREIKDMMINNVRSFIFTTALPPINILWSKFILKKIPFMTKEREHLHCLQQYISENFTHKDVPSHIFPYLIGDSNESMEISDKLKTAGFYALPVRPPTVPEGTARIRFSLTAQISLKEIEFLLQTICKIKNLQSEKK